MANNLFLWLISSLLLLTFVLPSHSVQVEVFYEALNEAARKFFVYQLNPEVYALHKTQITSLKLYPYGRTQSNEEHLSCPFGAAQCSGNKIQACFIKAESPKQNDPAKEAIILAFVHCFFKNRFSEKESEVIGEKCMPEGIEGLTWKKIQTCLLEDETVNDEYLEVTKKVENEIKTDGLVVRIDGHVNATHKSQLIKEICSILDSKSGVCEKPSYPNVKVAIYYEAMESNSATYLSRQVADYYHILEDFVDIELVPFGNTQKDATGYKCARGEAQCVSNQYQALVVDAYMHKVKNGYSVNGPTRAIQFIACVAMSTEENIYRALEGCSTTHLGAKDYKTFIDSLKKTNDPEVTRILTEMSTKTAKLKAPKALVLPRLPLVTVNGKEDHQALDSLLGRACSLYTNKVKSSACKKTKVTILYEPLNHRTREFFLKQLRPAFNHLHGLIDLQLLPAGRTVNSPPGRLTCPAKGVEARTNQCLEMKWHACTLNYFLTGRTGNSSTEPIHQDIFNWIICTFKNTKQQDVAGVVETCAGRYIETAAWKKIQACVKSGADAILVEYVAETGKLLRGVEDPAFPVILVDKKVAELRDVCTHYDKNHRPVYCLQNPAIEPTKITMKIFYEALNDASKRFFTGQLTPWFGYIEDLADISYIPAGNVIESGHSDGVCDKNTSTSPCVANKLHAIVLDKLKHHPDDGDVFDSKIRALRFLSCFSGHANVSKDVYLAAEGCAEKTLPKDVAFDWFQILQLLTSPAGAEKYLVALEETATFKEAQQLKTFTGLPWIMLGEKHSRRAVTDLLQAVCASSLHADEKPAECTPLSISVYYSALDTGSLKFFTDQLIPLFNTYRERLHIDLVPFGVPKKERFDEECKGAQETVCLHNKIHACTVSKFFKDEPTVDFPVEPKKQALEFTKCLLTNDTTKDKTGMAHAEKCAHTTGLSLATIKPCINEDEGTLLLEHMHGKMVQQFEDIKSTPWIQVNGVHSASAEKSLKTTVCDYLTGDLPAECLKKSSPGTTKKPSATTKKATAKPTTKKAGAAVTTPKPKPKPAGDSGGWRTVDTIIVVVVSVIGVLIAVGLIVLIWAKCSQKGRSVREA